MKRTSRLHRSLQLRTPIEDAARSHAIRRKIHLGINEETLEIRAVEITGSHISDAPVLPDLLSQIPANQEIGSVIADGAYDTRKCHDAIADRGAARPGHFDGVATVVSKLFLQSDADKAFFGEKDFQQVQVVRRVARDLDLKTRIVPCATVREPDGLALSSRNMRLDDQARKTASVIYQALTEVARSVGNGAQISTALDAAKTAMLDAGIGPIDYLELRHQDDLTLANNPSRPSRVFVAAWLGPVRLIDNIAV